jgi:hypothetical protein
MHRYPGGVLAKLVDGLVPLGLVVIARPGDHPSLRATTGKEMTLQIPPSSYQVAIDHSLAGSLRPATVTLGFGYFGTNFETDAGLLALSYVTTVMHSMADVWTCVNISFAVQEGTVLELAQDVLGGTSHTPTTANTAFLVKKLTSSPGRRNRGRFFLPGVSEQDVDAIGNVVPSKITELQGNLDDFYAGCVAAHFNPELFHNTPPGALSTSVTRFLLEPLAATQRRRMRG